MIEIPTLPPGAEILKLPLCATLAIWLLAPRPLPNSFRKLLWITILITIIYLQSLANDHQATWQTFLGESRRSSKIYVSKMEFGQLIRCAVGVLGTQVFFAVWILVVSMGLDMYSGEVWGWEYGGGWLWEDVDMELEMGGRV
jgi:hypothetical protein